MFLKLRICLLQRFALSHARGGGPRLLMLCKASLAGLTVSLRERNGMCDEHMAVSCLGAEWKFLRDGVTSFPKESMVSVHCFAAPVDIAVGVESASSVSLLHDWRDRLNGAIVLYPLPPVGSTRRTKAGTSSASDALRLLFAPKRRRRRMAHAPGVKAVLPKPMKTGGDNVSGKVSEHSETEIGDSSCVESGALSSSSSSDDCRMVDVALRKGGPSQSTWRRRLRVQRPPLHSHI